MSYHHVTNWPPVWTKSTVGGNSKPIKGEVGILEHVHFVGPISNKCYLLIEYENEGFIGALIFSDPLFCAQIANLLQHHIGRSIQEIGDLDLSYTF